MSADFQISTGSMFSTFPIGICMSLCPYRVILTQKTHYSNVIWNYMNSILLTVININSGCQHVDPHKIFARATS